MNLSVVVLACASLHLGQAGTQAAPLEQPLQPGIWRAWLDSPGGELPFQLELSGQPGQPGASGGQLQAVIHNGPERIPFELVRLEGRQLTLARPHYDSTITARLNAAGELLEGEWVKRGSGDAWTRMPFRADFCSTEASSPAAQRCRFAPVSTAAGPSAQRSGRWRVRFGSSDEDSVAVFEGGGMDLRGTFLTTLGDYRFLAGDARNGQLRLSCFDGAHAFLFKAAVKPGAEGAPASLEGDFWSRDTWHETWTAVLDDDAALPDAFGLTRWNEEVPLASLTFPDLDGTERSLADPAFRGKARILKLFGTWCPNCNDEARYLVELDRHYRARGLSIVGLAFEHSGEFERDAEQVRRYAEHHRIEFPLLLAGVSDKGAASDRFPLIDRVRAYPTTLFLDAEGVVRAIHTGFSGPATGAAYTKLREDFERLIEALLDEADSGRGEGQHSE